MANINDFKIVKKKSKKYFDLLIKELNIDVSTKNLTLTQMERLGFYIFAIDNIISINDMTELSNLVTDTDFNKILFDEKFDDAGIDGIYIDEEEKLIHLFNFKYREKFKEGKQGTNSTILSTKLINSVINEDIDHLEGKTKEYSKVIIEKLNSNETYKIILHVVSNEFIQNNEKDEHLKALEKLYDLEVNPIDLDKISDFIALRPEPVHAKLTVDKDAIMSFSEDSISSSTSYILRLPLSEVIRITCDDKSLREDYAIENLIPLSNVDINMSVLFDNVRGLVVKSKFNKNMYDSLTIAPHNFFMFNNGLTLTAGDIKAKSINAKKRVKIDLQDIQVLNGGQSLRTLHSFNQSDPKNLEDYLSCGEVLVRVFNTAHDSELNNKIAEYTNSQNSIANVDLKSLRSEQLALEKYLNDHDIIYSRKTGDTGIDINKDYDYKISMEKFGQILMSVNGMPEKATNQKKVIFSKYYEELFIENFEIENAPKYVKNYFLIKNEYSKTRFTSSDQKIFYIIYMNSKENKTFSDLINVLEDAIKEYIPPSGKTVSEARKLIQVEFKKHLDNSL